MLNEGQSRKDIIFHHKRFMTFFLSRHFS